MKNRKLILLLILVLLTIKVGAQNTLLLLDGSVIKSKKIEYKDSLKVYNYLNKKNKSRWVEKDFVYSISNSTGVEKIVYQPDKLSQEIGIKEMRSFIKGEQYAHSNYKPYLAGTSGFVVGLGSTVSFPYLGITAFYSTLIPLTYVGTQVFIKHKVKIMNVPSDSAYPDFYIKGFRDKAVKKRFIYTIIGSVVGSGIGLGINAYRLTH